MRRYPGGGSGSAGNTGTSGSTSRSGTVTGSGASHSGDGTRPRVAPGGILRGGGTPINVVQDRIRGELRRALRTAVEQVSNSFLDKLSRNGVETWKDLAYLSPKSIDDLRLITGVPKVKLMQLVDVLKSDDAQLFNVTPRQVKR